MKQRGIALNGPVVRHCRTILGLSVKHCAEHMGVDGPAWSQWESGKRNLDEKRLATMAEVLRVTDERILRADLLTEVTAEAERNRLRRTKSGAAA